MSDNQAKILKAIAHGNFAICHIGSNVKLKWKTVAKHVEYLQNQGYVEIERDMYGDGSRFTHWCITPTLTGRAIAGVKE